MKKLTITALLLLSSLANAQTVTTDGYVACISESLYDELITAVVTSDALAIKHLLKNGCVNMRGGVRVSVLGQSWTGTVKARVYVGGTSLLLWMPREAIVK